MRHLFRSAPQWVVLALLSPAPILSQSSTPAAKPSPPLPATDHAFAAEPFVIRSSHLLIEMKPDGTGTRTESFAVTVQSEAALRQFGVVGLPFASASERPEFHYVRVHHPDGATVDTPLDGAQEQAEQVTRQAPFYSDLKQKQLPVRSLRVGDTLEWEISVARFKAEAPNHFWGTSTFLRGAIVLDQSLELHLPAASQATVWTNPRTGIKPEESTAAGQRIYRWNWHLTEPTVGPQAEAATKAKAKVPLTPDEELDATEGALPDVSWTTFRDWAAVGAWYRELEGSRPEPDDAIKAKVAEITAGKTTQAEKAHAVYAWVSGQIRYVGVALGIGRFQPHAASAVLDNQYGDCKDKHTLLAAMLTAIGLHPDAVLIGSGIRFNQAVPSPASFNHLITRVQLDGHDVWLDSTTEVAPFQVLLAPIRDHQALVIPATGAAFVARTPNTLPFSPSAVSTVVGSIDKDLTSDSTIKLTFRGDDEVVLRAILRQISPAQYGEFTQRFMASIGFGGTTSQAEISSVEDLSQPITLSFHYHRVKEADWGANRITAIFTPINLPVVDEKDPPRGAILLGIPRTETSTVELKLAEGWGAELPEAVHAHTAFANCDVTYHLDKGTLFAERRLAILADKVPFASQSAYKTWYADCGASGVPYIQLTTSARHRAKASSAAADPPASNPEAARLVSKAYNEASHGDYKTAAEDLEGAKALNPQQEALWGDFGMIAMHENKIPEAMKNYQKEIDFHPESSFAWRSLAGLQYATGDHKASFATLTQWTHLRPDNPEAPTMLITMLLDDKQDAAALQAANSALAQLPAKALADSSFQFALGQAQLRGADKTKGAATLAAIARTSTDPMQRNNAAYELARAGLELPLAEATERSVLEKLSAETRSWTGDESSQTMQIRSSLLASSWDTMGWILYLENKPAEAEPWIRAAFFSAQHHEIAEHLGDISLARGNPSAALRAYELALAATPSHRLVNGKPEAIPPDALLTAKIAKARAAGGKDDEAPTLRSLRTFSLGAAPGMSGTGEYQLILSPHGIESISSTGKSDLPKALELLRKLKLPDSFPPDTDARLVRTGSVSCFNDQCELVLARQ